MEQQPPASPLLTESSRPRRTPALAPPPRKKRRWIWIVLLVLFALAFFMVWRHKPDVAAAGAPGGRRGQGTVTINVATVGRGQMAVKLDAIGTVTPTYTATINSQVSGQVISVHYREGQTVAKGTPLIDIDPRQYQAALDTAQGTLARDRGVLAQATMDLERYQSAWARNAIAKQQLDDQAKLVEQDKGLVQADEGAVESDQVQLAYCHITSPISGRVGLRLVDPGNIVTANSTTPLVVVTQVQPITVVFTIPEDSLAQVEAAIKHAGGRHALETTVFDRANEHQLAVGKLLSLDNQIDTTTGTIKLRSQFDNRDMALFPNQFVNTRLLTSVLQNQIMVPTSTIQRNGQQAFVYRITNNQATLVNVKIGHADGNMTAVEGLNDGDQIADSSFERLQNHAKVRVVKEKLGSADSEESGTP
jgi:multidrug efflux system membrane fusion protein